MNAYEKIEKYGQNQLLKFEADLSEADKKALLEQIESLDFDVVKNIEHLSKPAPRVVETGWS